MRKKYLFITILILLLSTNVKALDLCKESNLHKKYMELSKEERKKYIEPIYCELENNEIKKERRALDQNYPNKYNSNDYGYITSVKNQGIGGSCWAFACIGAVEANAKINGLGTHDLSEMHLLYSVYGGSYLDTPGRTNRYNVGVDEGGFARYAASYFFGGYGMLSESEWIYDENLPMLYSNNYKIGRNILSTKSYKLHNIKNEYSACSNTDINTMKSRIMEDGSVVADVHMDSKYNKNYDSRYLQVTTSQESFTNHEILVVGWDDTISKDKFLNATRDGAWIVKNSWGTDWGDRGYFYVSYDDDFICGNVSTFTGVSNKTYDYTYKGAEVIHNYDIIYYNKALFATKIEKASIKNEKLSRVSFATAAGIHYKVYMSESNTLTSNNDWILLASGTSTNYGIDSVDISNTIPIKNTFTIIVEYTIPYSNGAPLLTSCLDNYDMSTIDYKSNTNYYSDNGTNWYDMTTMPVGNMTRKCGAVIYTNTNILDDNNTIYPSSISFNKDKLYLVKNNKTRLETIFTPNNTTYKTLTWTSSNKDIIEVSQNGEITAISKGTATITATTPNNKVATCEVNVYDTEILPTSISLNYSKLTLDIGNVDILTPTISPINSTNTNVTFTSSNQNIATVNEKGEVTAISKGTATITAKTTNNKEATCIVTVKEKDVLVNSISLDKTEEVLEINQTKELHVSFNPTNATDKTIIWSTSNPSIVGVSADGKITGYSEGTATVTAHSSNGKVANCVVTVIKQNGVFYKTHIQSYGWEETFKQNGETSGTSGEAKRLEGIKIKLLNMEYSGDILYRTHIQSFGWEENFKKNGEMSGTSGLAKRLEAIEIKLTGEISNYYDIYYRVHAQSFGWLGWAKNGESAGTAGYAKRLEAIQIVLVKKDNPIPSYINLNEEAYKRERVLYKTHVQTYGWQDYVSDGKTSGTFGEAKRLEAIKIKLYDQEYSGNILYRTHIQSFGWEEEFRKNDELSGTSGLAKRLEAIEIKLDGEMANHFDIYYRVHAQTFGWLNWAKNGEASGTAGYAKRLEGIEIVLVKKGSSPPSRDNINNPKAYIENN